MAQLIKLNDYISRYECDIYRYPTQFMRIKQEHWKKLYAMWSHQHEELWLEEIEEAQSDEPKSFFSKLKARLVRDGGSEDRIENQITFDQILPATEEELKRYFLDKLYPFQLKWATSTVSHVSFIDPAYEHDSNLKFFLQRFPDIYLIMYEPIFQIKKAVVDGAIMMISPIGIEILTLLEAGPDDVIIADGDRTWMIQNETYEEKIINPLIELKRTEQIVKNILSLEGVDFPIHKSIISRTNPIVYSEEPYRTNLIGRNRFDEWFNQKRQLSAPLKNVQLKAAELLLKHCATIAVKRPEWDDDDIFRTVSDED